MLGSLGWISHWAFWLGVIVSLYTYVDYYHSIVRGETKPHVLGWTSLGVITTLSACLQFSASAALGAVLTLLAGGNNFFVAYQAWRRGGKLIVSKRDIACLVMSAACVAVWLGANQDEAAVIGLSLASLFSIAMTFLKSWSRPYDEPVRKYALGVLRYVFATVAVVNYNFVSGFYPTLWIGVHLAMVIFLVARRHQLKSPAKVVHLYEPSQKEHPATAYMTPCCGGPNHGLSADELTDDWEKTTCNNFAEQRRAMARVFEARYGT